MASKFSMVNTSGMFDAGDHLEATDRMQGAMEELKIKNEQQERVKQAKQQAHEKHEAEQVARLQRAKEAAAAAGRDDSFIRAKSTNENQARDDEEDEEDEDDDDALLDELDADPELERLREARLAQLKARYKQQQELLAKGHGEYREITQDEFLKEVTSSPLVAVHFYHREFERCKIMDMHLERLAKRHIECKFLKINAEKAPFFVEKLVVRVLPTVIAFKDGVAFPERVVGFDGLAADDEEEEESAGFGSRPNYRAKSSDSFPTVALARKLVKMGAITHDDADADEDA